MIRLAAVLFVAAIGLGSAWLLERSENKAQSDVIVTLKQSVKTAEETINSQRLWAAQREMVITALLSIDKEVQAVQIEIRRQDVQQAKALQELIKNDKVVRDYMLLTVPGNLGLQYGREATTDPTRYGPGGSLPFGPLPDARQTSPKK